MGTSVLAQRQLLRPCLRRLANDVLAGPSHAARASTGTASGAAAADCDGDAWPLFLCPTLVTGPRRSGQPVVARGPRVTSGLPRRSSGTRSAAQHRSLFTSRVCANDAMPAAAAPDGPSSSEVPLAGLRQQVSGRTEPSCPQTSNAALRRALEKALVRHTLALNNLVRRSPRHPPVERLLDASDKVFAQWQAASGAGPLPPALHDGVADRLYVWARIVGRWLGVRDWQRADDTRQAAARRMDLILQRADVDAGLFDREEDERRVETHRRAIEARLEAGHSPPHRACSALRSLLPGSRLSLQSLRARAASLHGDLQLLQEQVEELLRENAELLRRVGPRPLPGFSASLPQLKPLGLAVGALYDAHAFSTRQRGPAMAERNSRVAQRVLRWLFAHPSVLVFAAGNDFAWAVRPLNDLLALLRDPIGAIERNWYAQDNRWRVSYGLPTLLVLVLGLVARRFYAPAVQLYFLASDRLLVGAGRRGAEMVMPELVRKRLLHRLSHAKEDAPAARMASEIERKAPSGALGRLEQSTLRTLAAHYARLGDSSRVSRTLEALAAHKPADSATFAFHIRMSCAARAGDVAECLRLAGAVFDLEPQADHPPRSGLRALTPQMLAFLLQANLRKGDVVGAEEWLERHSVLGLTPTRASYNGMLMAYARRAEVASAISLFDDMSRAGVQPDKASYTALIVLFGVRKDAESAVRAMRAMRANGIRPDRIAYGALLDAYVESAAWEEVVELYSWQASQATPDLRPMAAAANALLKSHVLRASPVPVVSAAFDDMRRSGIEPNTHTYSLLLQSAADAGDIERAEQIFSELDRTLAHSREGQPGGARLHHFTIMMHTYLRRGDVDTARSYYEEMRQRGIEPDSVTWSILIESYIRVDDEDGLLVAAELASRLADEAETPAAQRQVWPSPSIQEGQLLEPIYGPLLAAAARRGDAQEAQRIILLLTNAGTPVRLPFWTMLLEAHRSGGDFAGCDRVWAHIYQLALDTTSADLSIALGSAAETTAGPHGAGDGSAQHGVRASSSDERDPARRNLLCIPLSIMLDVLSRSGRHIEVVQLWKQLQRDGFRFDPHNWNHLCVALTRADRYEEAMRVVNDVLAEEPPRGRRQQTQALQDQRSDNAGKQGDWSESSMPSELARLDIAEVSQTEAAETPSRPPSRRHQARDEDESAAHTAMQTAPQDEELPEPDEDPEPPGALSDVTTSLLERASPSYWFPHFDTLQALAVGLDEMRRGGPTPAATSNASAAARDPRARHRRLMRTFPRAVKLLERHEVHVQAIEEAYALREAATARRGADE